LTHERRLEDLVPHNDQQRVGPYIADCIEAWFHDAEA
jgi:hypothetical protein